MSTPTNNRDLDGGMQIVHRIAVILKALSGESEALSLTQIAKRVGLPRSTVHRLVTALAHERLVVPASRSGGYRLGPAVGSLLFSASREFIGSVHPFLVVLSKELNETVDLAVLEHDRVLFVDQVPAAAHRLRAVSSVGATFPPHCTANGKALLASLPDEEVERLVSPRLERLTAQTITSRMKLLAELAQIRVDGVAYDREEHTVGICAVGTTVASPAGMLAAVTIPLPAQRFYGNEDKLTSALLRARRSLNSVLVASG